MLSIRGFLRFSQEEILCEIGSWMLTVKFKNVYQTLGSFFAQSTVAVKRKDERHMHLIKHWIFDYNVRFKV